MKILFPFSFGFPEKKLSKTFWKQIVKWGNGATCQSRMLWSKSSSQDFKFENLLFPLILLIYNFMTTSTTVHDISDHYWNHCQQLGPQFMSDLTLFLFRSLTFQTLFAFSVHSTPPSTSPPPLRHQKCTVTLFMVSRPSVMFHNGY